MSTVLRDRVVSEGRTDTRRRPPSRRGGPTVGVEIVAALVVAIRPRYGACLVAAWLAGIVVNLLSSGEWHDVAVPDFGLMLAALALARLASVYDRRGADA